VLFFTKNVIANEVRQSLVKQIETALNPFKGKKGRAPKNAPLDVYEWGLVGWLL
jgi:hypothetical protein